MRYIAVAIGMVLGWSGGKLLLFIHDRLVVQGPERGFPSIAPLVDYLVVSITSTVLGGILGWIGYRQYCQSSEKTSKPAGPTLTLFRFPTPVTLVIAFLTFVLLADAVGLPLWQRLFLRRASKAWQLAQVENNKQIVSLLTNWNAPSTSDSLSETKRIEVLSASLVSDSEWSDGTAAWGDEEWSSFAKLASTFPSRLVGYQDHLWEKLLTLPPASNLRETLLDAIFSIALSMNDARTFWKRIEQLEGSEKASLHLFTSQLKKERSSNVDQNPWWLICDTALDMLEKLEPNQRELIPDLSAILLKIDSSGSIQSDDGIKLINRLRAIVDRWQEGSK